MDRRTARKEAFCILFEYFFNDDVTIEAIMTRQAEERGIVADEYLSAVLFGTAEKKDELDEVIKPYLKGWRMERISKISLTALRLAAYEIMYMDDIPENASVNEAVELVKTYGGDTEPSFVNATLRAFIRNRNENKTEAE